MKLFYVYEYEPDFGIGDCNTVIKEFYVLAKSLSKVKKALREEAFMEVEEVPLTTLPELKRRTEKHPGDGKRRTGVKSLRWGSVDPETLWDHRPRRSIEDCEDGRDYPQEVIETYPGHFGEWI